MGSKSTLIFNFEDGLLKTIVSSRYFKESEVRIPNIFQNNEEKQKKNTEK